MALLAVLFTYIGYGVQYVIHWRNKLACVTFCITLPLALAVACIGLFVVHGTDFAYVAYATLWLSVGAIIHNYLHG